MLPWVAVVLGVAVVAVIGGTALSSGPARATAPGGGPRTGTGSTALLRATTAPAPDPTPSAPGTPVPSPLDESDPFLTVADGHYLLATSGTTGVDPVDVPVSTSTDFVHWTAPVDALPVLPPWASRGFTWAPDIHRFGHRYALYFTALVVGSDPATECIGSAFADSATGPYAADPAPFICQTALGGSIDPRVFVDTDGTPWMLWKSDQNIGGSATPTTMWSQRLSPDGTRLVGLPSVLLSPDRPWQGTIVEAPDMVEVGGAYWLVYSGNWYNTPAYAIGAARCRGPAGPCADTGTAPLLATNAQGQGPGEASVFHDAAGVWLLYSPERSFAPTPDVFGRPVYITRLGVDASGPYLASGPSPLGADLLSDPLWSATP